MNASDEIAEAVTKMMTGDDELCESIGAQTARCARGGQNLRTFAQAFIGLLGLSLAMYVHLFCPPLTGACRAGDFLVAPVLACTTLLLRRVGGMPYWLSMDKQAVRVRSAAGTLELPLSECAWFGAIAMNDRDSCLPWNLECIGITHPSLARPGKRGCVLCGVVPSARSAFVELLQANDVPELRTRRAKEVGAVVLGTTIVFVAFRAVGRWALSVVGLETIAFVIYYCVSVETACVSGLVVSVAMGNDRWTIAQGTRNAIIATPTFVTFAAVLRGGGNPASAALAACAAAAIAVWPAVFVTEAGKRAGKRGRFN